MMSPLDTSKEIVVMDWTQVNWMHTKVVALSLVDFFLYGFILYTLCALPDPMLSSFAFFAAQVSVGLPTTRTFHSLGQKARGQLTLLDPSDINSNWKKEEVRSNPEMISRAFEKAYGSVSSGEPEKTDDMNDLAWFVILVWATVSSAFLLSILGTVYSSLLSVAILAGMALVVYLSGYWSTSTRHLLEDFEELEFFILNRTRRLLKVKVRGKCHPSVIWLVKNNKKILFDIAFDIILDTKTDTSTEIRYIMGIPSREYESITVTSSQQLTARLIERIHSLKLVKSEGWFVEPHETPKGMMVSIRNPSPLLQFKTADSLFVQPIAIDEQLDWLVSALSETASAFVR
ncbi:MAG: hypothetical protein JSW61_11330 [Candidatus Thorarchaeota archaeon]|nr:MAG: hypothetical protein JSW61_11330 [Candidatus Thorarchaeota archaeon]